MEDPEREQAAMAEFLRFHNPQIVQAMAKQIADISYPPGTDVEAATAAIYADLAAAWKYPLRRDAEYLAWRRGHEPGYMLPDEPDPSDWENLPHEERRQQQRKEHQLAQARERVEGLSPARRRVLIHVEESLLQQGADVHGRLRMIANRGDADVAALALTVSEGLARIEGLLRVIASDGAMLAPDDNSEI